MSSVELSASIVNAINNENTQYGQSIANLQQDMLEKANLSSGIDENKPTPTGSGTFYWATDTLKLYFDAPT